ncbi:MAG: CdaR family protein [Blastocatellia bacterium]
MSSEPQNFVEKLPNRLFFKHILRKIFLEDWAMKLIALGITLALWLGVTGLSTPSKETKRNIPLDLRISENTVVTNSPIESVDVVVSGDKRRVGQINPSSLSVTLDLTDVPPGDRIINLNPENVSVELPTGVKLEEVQPNKIAIRLEAVEEKEISVKIETAGEIQDGFELYGKSVLPVKVLVRGPANFVRSLTSVSTDKIDLSGRNGDFVAKQVRLNLSNPNATLLETVVDVTFRIGEKRSERMFLVPLNDGSGRRATVVLFGGRSLLAGIRADDLKVEIIKNEAGEEVPQLKLPPNLEGSVEVRKLKIGP